MGEGELRHQPVSRRRVVRELTDHLDDAIAELRNYGLSERAATNDAAVQSKGSG